MRKNLSDLVYEDMGFEDITTNSLIPPGLHVKGRIIAREAGVIAGLDIALDIFNEFSVECDSKIDDGSKIQSDQVVMEIEGDPRHILSVERTVLNLMMRMSGIATLTSKMVKKVHKIDPYIIVAGTRKTTPGLQFFEKNAVRLGGGDTHRYRLDDSVLIKDNHLAVVGSVEEAVSRARKYASFTKKIEIEVETQQDALKAVNSGADIVMLDNMSPEKVSNVLALLDENDLRGKVLIEVSGGINFENIVDYAKTGVDVISTGYMTHSARSLDLSLELDKIT